MAAKKAAKKPASRQPSPPSPGKAVGKAAGAKGLKETSAKLRGAQGTGGFATAAERKAIIKEAERVFGKGGFQLTKSTQRSTVNGTPKLTAISKTAKSDVNTKSVYASTRAYSSFNPFKNPVKVSTYIVDEKSGGGLASRKK